MPVPVQSELEPMGKYFLIRAMHIDVNGVRLDNVINEVKSSIESIKTDYYTKQQADDKFAAKTDVYTKSEVDTALSNKVSVQSGYGLISDAEKAQIQTNKANITAAETAIAGKASTEAVTQLQTDMSVQTARMDQLVGTVPAGSADEIADARVTADGKTEVNLGNAIRSQVSSLKETITEINNGLKTYALDGSLIITGANFKRSAYSPVTGSESDKYNYRVSNRNEIRFPVDVTLMIEDGFRILPYRIENGTWKQKSWFTGREYNLPKDEPMYMQIARATEDTTELADVDLFVSKIKVYGTIVNKLSAEIEDIKSKIGTDKIDEVELESGRWSYSEKQDYPTRLRNSQMIFVKENTQVKFNSPDLKFYFAVLENKTATAYQQTFGWKTPNGNEMSFTVENDGYLIVNVGKTDDSEIFVADFESSEITIVDVYKKTGKDVKVYRFGGEGNDWCFVRTPDGYDPERVKPYPFIICNHGNGWTMDGSAAKANWTKRTMYVPMDDPDYVSDPTQYNGTADETLWYSNPTIEKFLEAGYIVCGCENYGDNLYGNDLCRNACVDFFNHMTKMYNVEDRCYMIGASNGAQTTINASYLLGERVKAVILQYPLTCLVDHYEAYDAHKAGIRAAYGITDAAITKDDLIKVTATHDVMHTNVISDTKVGYFPPTKIYYSESDRVVNYQVNALSLYELLESSLKVVEKVKCSGNHGDYSHFDPDAYLAWFEKF